MLLLVESCRKISNEKVSIFRKQKTLFQKQEKFRNKIRNLNVCLKNLIFVKHQNFRTRQVESKFIGKNNWKNWKTFKFSRNFGA